MSAKIHGFRPIGREPCRKSVDVLLRDNSTTQDVFWSPTGNSYVLLAVPDGTIERNPSLAAFMWRTEDGSLCRLVSVNGSGEIRWSVSPSGFLTGESLGPVAHFKLVPA